jgi:hypothetical protein
VPRADLRPGWAGVLLLGAALPGCRAPSGGPPPAPAAPAIRFTDATESAGIRFTHDHGGGGKKLMPETVGSGAAWFDYDGDGRLDLFLANCAPLPGSPDRHPRSALYRNRGDGTFEDRTAGSGLDVPLYAQGVTAADYDADGDADLFVTCLGPNHLFRNDGGGRFRDVGQAAGLGGGPPWRWHTGSTWLDYDADGRLDLFVARYVKWTPETDQFCGIPGELKRYCPPWKYEGERCALYRNLGNGRFADVSRASGVDAVVGKWFQPLVVDENDDGRPDVVVTSDGTPTALFRNQEGRRFTDVAAETGMGVSESGMPKGGMGVDAADWRNDGRESVLIGNFAGEGLSFFEPTGGLYTNQAPPTGLAAASLRSLTFGLAFLDADGDGRQDALIGNGHIDDYIERFEAEVKYAQPLLLFHNRPERWRETAAEAGLTDRLVVRGLAVADYDDDGDPDFVLVQNNRPARLFRNDTRTASWTRVVLRGGRGNPTGVGARVEVSAGSIQTRRARAGSSFLGQDDSRLLFGLGAARAGRVTVHWPGGGTTEAPLQLNGDTVMRR